MNEATPNMMQDQGPEHPGAVDPTALLIADAARLVKQAVRPLDCSTVRDNHAAPTPNSLTAEQPNSLLPGGQHD